MACRLNFPPSVCRSRTLWLFALLLLPRMFIVTDRPHGLRRAQPGGGAQHYEPTGRPNRRAGTICHPAGRGNGDGTAEVSVVPGRERVDSTTDRLSDDTGFHHASPAGNHSLLGPRVEHDGERQLRHRDGDSVGARARRYPAIDNP